MFQYLYIFLSTALIVHTSGADGGVCTYVQGKHLHMCHEIREQFPTHFYGGYYLKCVDCRIPVFSSTTFPVTAELVSFNISESGIQNITSGAFSNLPRLQYLYLHHNRIFGISKNAFSSLRKLYELDLQHNELTELKQGMFNDLESIMISLNNNHLKEIPPNVFEGVLGILALNFSKNQIGILSVESFNYLEILEILDLGDNKICYIPLGIFKYVRMIKDLNLSSNKLKSFTTGTFSGLVNLQTLSLAQNEFSEFDPSVLLPLGKLSNLDISRNGLFYLDAHSVHMNAPTIRKLKIDDNLWSCTLLTNMIQFLKSVNVDTSENTGGRYDITNVNGVGCSLEPLNQYVTFEQFLRTAVYHTNRSINYC